jgi:hypothetical protein
MYTDGAFSIVLVVTFLGPRGVGFGFLFHYFGPSILVSGSASRTSCYWIRQKAAIPTYELNTGYIGSVFVT